MRHKPFDGPNLANQINRKLDYLTCSRSHIKSPHDGNQPMRCRVGLVVTIL